MVPTRARASKLLDEIIEQVAKEEGISVKRTDAILQSVFSLIAADIRSGTLKGTNVFHLGKFKVKPYNIIKHHNKQNGDNTETKG